MKQTLFVAALAAGLCGIARSAVTVSDSFGDGAFAIDFVPVGNPGNAADSVGLQLGAVGHGYQIGNYEISRGMIATYNAMSGGPAITLGDLSSYGGNGPDRPATGVTWNEAARFVNWLNTSKGYAPAYKFTTTGSNDNISLWTPADGPAYNPNNPVRNANAHYFMPDGNEWYKAAFYDPTLNGGAGGYFTYATGSNTAPTRVRSGTAPGTAVYGDFLAGPADIAAAGGLSPYGTMAQSGNVEEWTETRTTGNPDWINCLVVGGGWGGQSDSINSSNWAHYFPVNDGMFRGFRVAAVPEPAVLPLCAIGALALLRRRKIARR